jgi:hypothetical protein
LIQRRQRVFLNLINRLKAYAHSARASQALMGNRLNLLQQSPTAVFQTLLQNDFHQQTTTSSATPPNANAVGEADVAAATQAAATLASVTGDSSMMLAATGIARAVAQIACKYTSQIVSWNIPFMICCLMLHSSRY